ncbi:MAG: redox-regulated ATPase YchF [Verrucomicrobia bacterium CG1_02_43_26]|nr:MAG: redox-regulated ATPase YchF [Verrucomicrobia bacterium CG1_02_43_26]
MIMKAGILGLPNVGKSTLFNALTRTRKAESANYPFCTIEPNVGIVVVPDWRLARLTQIVKPKEVVPTAIEIVDIAGLVKGASQGEGLGNQFLSNIRLMDALIHVVRCFEDDDVIHNMGSVDPIRDIEVISTELILSDLQSAQAQLDKNIKRARGPDAEAKANVALLTRLLDHLNEGKPANILSIEPEELPRLKQFNLLSSKPIVYACNVAEDELEDADQKNPYVQQVKAYAKMHHDANSCVISAKIESDLVDLAPEEAKEFLAELGVEDSGVSQLIRATYDLLGLASYFTAGEKEVRAWTFVKGMKAPECAGIIHTDFQKGFIKAEVVSFEDLDKYGSYSAAREAGRYRLEGKEYPFKDGDVVLFRFNV